MDLTREEQINKLINFFYDYISGVNIDNIADNYAKYCNTPSCADDGRVFWMLKSTPGEAQNRSYVYGGNILRLNKGKGQIFKTKKIHF